MALFSVSMSAHSATLECVSNQDDISKNSPMEINAVGFWHLDIPKKFEIVTENGNVISVNYKFGDQVQEDGIVFDSNNDKNIAFKNRHVDLSKDSHLYKGFQSVEVAENSKKATLEIRSKFKKWGMDNDGVNTVWTLTLDKTQLTGTIVGKDKVSLFEQAGRKLVTRFSCQ